MDSICCYGKHAERQQEDAIGEKKRQSPSMGRINTINQAKELLSSMLKID